MNLWKVKLVQKEQMKIQEIAKKGIAREKIIAINLFRLKLKLIEKENK